jgi:hypothetical protein
VVGVRSAVYFERPNNQAESIYRACCKMNGCRDCDLETRGGGLGREGRNGEMDEMMDEMDEMKMLLVRRCDSRVVVLRSIACGLDGDSDQGGRADAGA